MPVSNIFIVPEYTNIELQYVYSASKILSLIYFW